MSLDLRKIKKELKDCSDFIEYRGSIASHVRKYNELAFGVKHIIEKKTKQIEDFEELEKLGRAINTFREFLLTWS